MVGSNDTKQRRESIKPTDEVPFIVRILGGNVEAALQAGQLVANSERKDVQGFAILFQDPPSLNSDELTRSLRSYHPSLAGAVFEVMHNGDAGFSGLAGWDGHVVRIFGLNAPMPQAAVEEVVQPAHYPQELKQHARAHKAHALLSSMGTVIDPLEEYVALAVVSGVLAEYGAVVVCNSEARTSFPVAPLAAGKVAGDSLYNLRSLPLLVLYCGLVKYNVEGIDGTWMRSYGAHRFGIPDLAALIPKDEKPQFYFDLFNSICSYLRQTGAKIAAGQTAQFGEHLMRLRAPLAAEYFLESTGGLVVVEIVNPSEIN